MIEIDSILRLAAFALVAVFTNMIIKRHHEEVAQLINLAVIVICIIYVADMILNVFESIRSIFRLF